MTGEGARKRQTTFTLSDALISAIDKLKPEYGLRSRGAVVERLLEHLLHQDEEGTDQSCEQDQSKQPAANPVEEASSLVLIQRNDESTKPPVQSSTGLPNSAAESSSGIDLPGFVRKRTKQLQQTLSTADPIKSLDPEPIVSSVSCFDLEAAQQAAEDHWRSLYGQPPGDTVIEAAMIWLARDLWPSVDASDGRPFTWTVANSAMQELCSEWTKESPSVSRVMVVAGTLEDPFATASLAERMPTLIRRFVNRFRRSRQVTSFETLESTMTVHGALKLLGLSTQPGASVTLTSIKEAFKIKALNDHPDAGGSTESMRRLNEAYRLLRELYKR
ncbi:MAG: molecular chaperone DnaJ [Cyanobium sp. NAT70]|nr:molecular chaperone DnaJ [Cyanobium sp. NAT70]